MTHHMDQQPFPELVVHEQYTFKWGSFGQTNAALDAYGLEVEYADYPDQEKAYGGVTNFSVVLATPEEMGAPEIVNTCLDTAEVRIDSREDVLHPPRMAIALPVSREHYVRTLTAQKERSAPDQDVEEYLSSVKAALRPESGALTAEELFDDLYTERMVASVARLVREAGREALLSPLHAQRQEEVRKLGWQQRWGALAYAGAMGAGELFLPVSTGVVTAAEGVSMATLFGAYHWLHNRTQARILRREPSDEAIARRVADEVAESIQASFSPDWHINRQTAELQQLLDEADPTDPES